MSRRFQFSLKWLLVVAFGAACFFGGIRLGQDRQRRIDEHRYEARAAVIRGQITVVGPGIADIDGVDMGNLRSEALETRGFEGATPVAK